MVIDFTELWLLVAYEANVSQGAYEAWSKMLLNGLQPINFEEIGIATYLSALMWLGVWRLRVAGVVALGAEHA